MPSLFKKSLTVEEAADALLALMQKDFKQEWRSKLSSVSGLDPVRAEDELIFLDFFAVYFSLKFTRSPSWRVNGQLVFEKFFGLFATWMASFWASKKGGTLEDATRIINARLQAYGAVVNDPSSLDPDHFIHAIGSQYALAAFIDDSFIAADGHPREDRFPDFLQKMSQDHDEIVITVGGEAFNHRLQILHTWFDAHKVG